MKRKEKIKECCNLCNSVDINNLNHFYLTLRKCNNCKTFFKIK